MPNRLAHETSPYLLQHQDNPVDWYPWGPEALERAEREDKPVFLSIGYSACHWCHVMEHESFENESIARELNAHFVCIKVDREERPDLDQIYMNAVQALTGRGGWPMSVFLTPDQRPFYAGTYWPPQGRQGMPGFDEVIQAVAKAWETNREATLDMAQQVTEHLQANAAAKVSAGDLSRDLIDQAVAALRQTFDVRYGGFGGAPKFPAPMSLRLLLRHWQRTGTQSSLDMVDNTLRFMAAGGIYDHLGGGFARYSVDARWLVPHFEKMLYDNAQLAVAYLEAYQITGEKDFARTVRETLDYVLRDMTDAGGGFYSTEDADSEGVEGKFYTWTPTQVAAVLGDEAAATFARVYDVSDEGNFEGASILNIPMLIADRAKLLRREPADLEEELANSRAKLFAEREKRVHPHKDDKVITAWNGLMLEAFALAGAVLGEPKYIDAARKGAEFLANQLTDDQGRLLHTWRHGEAKVPAYLDDYTYVASGLLGLYEATFEEEYLARAEVLMRDVLAHFADDEQGFFYTAADQEQLLVRNKEWADNAVPSSNAVAALVLLKLAKLTGKEELAERAESTMRAAHGFMQQFPSAMGQMLLAVDFHLGPTYEIVLAAEPGSTETAQILGDLRRRFLPHQVLALADAQGIDSPLTEGKTMLGDAPTLYVCEGYTCQAPAQGADEIQHALDNLTREVGD